MRRLLMILGLVGFTSASFAAIPFANRAGTYEGQGTWAGRVGANGTLAVTATIKINRDVRGHVESIDVASSYHIVGLPMGDAYQIRQEKNGFFNLYGMNNKKRGTGYCVGDHCHIQMPGDQLEETILFEGACMSRFGSKVEFGMLWNWDEKLCLKP